tara:strand:- start:853 stop:1458 length:606 start_codon:yes stop_codon:yes gene_type:complete
MSNCVRTSNKKFSLNDLTRLSQTDGYKTVSEKASEKVGNYALRNFNSCECTADKQRQLSIVHPTVQFRDGCGWISMDGCNIDKDSDVRNAKTLTNTREIHQLQPREVLTEPLKSKGSFNQDAESALIFSKQTSEKRNKNNLSGVTIDRFVPQIKTLKNNIQDPIHYITEDNNKQWKRGGMDTRNIVRDSNRDQRDKRQFMG